MRIRKRWPLGGAACPPLPSSSSSSPPPPSLTVTPPTPPDLLPAKALHLLSSSQSQSGGGGGDGLHCLADQSVVQVRNGGISPPRPRDSANPNLPQRPDLQLTLVRGNNGWICAGSERDVKTDLQDSDQVEVDGTAGGGGGAGREHGEGKSLAAAAAVNNRRNENDLGAVSSVGISTSSSFPHQDFGRWCEGERAFPLKKRRGSFERKIIISDDTIVEKEKKMKTRVRTNKVAKTKWVNHKDDGNEEEDEEEKEEAKMVVMNGNGGAKKRGSGTSSSVGGLMMEGSRCSRVNGRGWRCCQQTLVGYSLCEHHLGKGRLRSMTSVRNRAAAAAAVASSTITNRPSKTIKVEQTGLTFLPSSTALKILDQKESFQVEEEEEDDDDEKPLMNAKKRKKKKIGMVKARSMSSLLGQPLLAPPIVTLLPPSSDPNMVI